MLEVLVVVVFVAGTFVAGAFVAGAFVAGAFVAAGAFVGAAFPAADFAAAAGVGFCFFPPCPSSASSLLRTRRPDFVVLPREPERICRQHSITTSCQGLTHTSY